ncbi:MAG: DNA-packaging protein, partial [Porphyrobacter sp.]|nr:DNA-packaging protein [Porphyrobacter sp.]
MKPERKLAPDTDIVAFLKSLDPEQRRLGIELLGPQERDALDRAWTKWAHDGQLEPSGDWSIWVIKAGRGFGKTLAGAQWITGLIATGEPLRFALVGATLEDARRVMVEGKSGLLEVADAWVTDWHASLGRLRFRTGAEATLFSGATPHLLRGPEHHYAWCDELAKWDKAQECWDMLQLGLRLGRHPRALVTTTPRSGSVLQAIMDEPDTVVTGGPTRANPHLPASWKQRVERLYAGTRLGRQELEGELLPNAAGALWTVELIERCRKSSPSSLGEGDHAQHGGGAPLRHPVAPDATSPRQARGGFSRVLIAVDPPSGDGTCGIIACAREGSGDASVAHILADHSVTARSPEGWAAAVAAAARAHNTIEVVAEQNQGGKMVKAVLHTADPGLRVKLVTASAGKATRAEPVSHLFEAGRAFLHGKMPELEAQLLGLIAGGGYEGPGHSPDRADAMVWGVTELMLGRRAEPRV